MRIYRNNNQNGSTAIILMVAVVLIIIGGVYVFKTLTKDDNLGTATSQETTTTPKNAEADIRPDVIQISLNPVGIFTGTATATRTFVNGKFTHTVTANTNAPAEGKFYEGWLVIKTPELKFLSTGKMTKQTDGTYTLSYSSDTDQSAYNSVIITEETEANGLDGKPETHVFDGSF